MARVAVDDYGAPVQAFAMSTITNLTISAAAATTAALTSSLIRIATDGDCWVLITAAGTSATSTTGFFLAAGGVEYIKITGGTSRVSIIQKGSATGTVNIMECA